MNYKNDLELARKIAQEVKCAGGETYFVGGCVRDELMGSNESCDIDIEVHKIKPDVLENILNKIGVSMEMGKSFGIYSLKGSGLDIAMPRTEKATGTGHKNFAVFVDPYIGVEKAAQRRDFTVNAIMKNVLTGEIIDCFGGRDDLKNGIIRHVSDESFVEDSLRVLRGAQFAARFEFSVAEETTELFKKMNLDNLPKERVFEELRKALLYADKPSLFFECLRKANKLSEWFGEIENLIGIEQNVKYHKEGDVWTHTMMVLDAATGFRDRTANPIGFMLSALVHDLGKIVATHVKDGEIHAYKHETMGLPIVENFMHRITSHKALIKYVINMTELHMKPNVTARENSSVKSTNKMFDTSEEPIALIYLALCDTNGKIPRTDTAEAESFLKNRLEIYNEYMSLPYVCGKDLIDAGIKPDENFKEMLSLAHKLRLAGVEKDSALKQVIATYFK